MKKTVIKISALTLAFVMSVMMFAACAGKKQPGLTKEYFEQNKAEVLADSVTDTSLLLFSDNLLEEADRTKYESFSVSVTDPASEMGFEIKLNNDSKAKEGSLDVVMDAEGEKYDASLYYGNKKLALSSEALLGEGKSYGITFDSVEKLAKKFDKSALASLMEFENGALASILEEAGITDEYIENIGKTFGKITAEAPTMMKSVEELYTLCESNYGEVTEETANVNGNEYEALVLEITYDNKLIEDIMDWYLGYVEKSMDTSTELVSAFIPEPYKDEILPAYTEELEYSMEEAREELRYTLEAIEISGASKVYIDKKTGKYLMEVSDVDITVDGETLALTAEQYMVDNGMVIRGEITADGETFEFDGKLTAKDGKWVYDFGISANGEELASMAFGLDYSKESESYKLFMEVIDKETDETIEMYASGKYSESSDGFELTVEKIYTNDGYEEAELNLNIEIKANKKADVNKPDDYVEILEMTEDELYGVIGRISGAAYGLSDLLYGNDYYEEDYYSEDYYGEDYEEFTITYDDYEDYADFYTYEEFCELVDIYNSQY